MNMQLYIYCVPDEHMGSFQFGSIMNRPAMNIQVHVCLHFLMVLLFIGDSRNMKNKKLAIYLDSINYLAGG